MPYKDLATRKLKNAGYSKAHHEKNKTQRLLQLGARRRELKDKWYEFKATLKCSECGFSHIAALDFHHKDPSKKEGLISRLISDGRFKKAEEEAKKCIILCANCHRIHHHKEKTPPGKVGFSNGD